MTSPFPKSAQEILLSLGFKEPTPVQIHTIPFFLNSSEDILVEAITGSGKTLAFLIPIYLKLQKYKQRKDIQHAPYFCILMAPTKDLCYQIYTIAKLIFPSLFIITGGKSLAIERLKLESPPELLIATPGRLDDHLQSRDENGNLIIHPNKMEILVIDEADRILDHGFKPTLGRIVSFLPKQRQNCLFSATINEKVLPLEELAITNPVIIRVAVYSKKNIQSSSSDSLNADMHQSIPLKLSNYYIQCNYNEKLFNLIQFLNHHSRGHTILVFFISRVAVEYFYNLFTQIQTQIFPETQSNPPSLFQIHGGLSTNQRRRIIDSFSKLTNESTKISTPSSILLCTDVLARGIDFRFLDWVVQFDPPTNPEAFIHRIGRTGRAGKIGSTVVYLDPKEISFLDYLKMQSIELVEYSSDFNDADHNESESLTLSSSSPETSTTTSPIKITSSTQLNKLIQSILVNSFALYNSSRMAFLSHVKAYQKHQCSYIFQWKVLNFGHLANMYGLLDLPVMPEISRRGGPKKIAPDFHPQIKVNPRILFEKEILSQKKKHVSWSTASRNESNSSREWAAKRRDKKAKKLKSDTKKQSTASRMIKSARQKRNRDDDQKDSEIEEEETTQANFQAELRLTKKFKQGKITKQEFETALAHLDTIETIRSNKKKRPISTFK